MFPSQMYSILTTSLFFRVYCTNFALMISDVFEASLCPQISYIISKRHTHLGCASLQCALVQIGLKLM